MRILILVVAVMMVGGCASAPVPATVAHVDLRRYAGRWYEIARMPQWFEKGCEGVTATYTLLPTGKVEVVNRCHEGSVNGKVREAKGTARVVDGATDAKLKVMFFWPLDGDYWVFRLNEDYTTAAVGSPDRKSLWILHRTKEMDAGEYERLVESLKEDGFPVERLRRTMQE